MPDLANLFDLRLPTDLGLRTAFAAAMNQFYVFTLVLVRVSGLTAIGPIFGQSVVPANVRVLLVLAIALIVTPTLQDHLWTGAVQLDGNDNGRIERFEVPDHLLPFFDRQIAERNRDPREGLALAEFVRWYRLPETVLDYARIGVGEFALGLVLGLGVFTILSGLTLAGQLIDQQSGLALGEIVNPGLDSQGSISGQFLYLFGVVVFLLLEPLGGHVTIITSLVETFQTMPAGEASISRDVVEYLSELVHLSLILAIRVAVPVLAVMSLVALTMGFLGHTVPQINVLVVGFAIRAMVALIVLTLCLSGTARLVIDTIPEVLRELVKRMTAL